MRKSNWKRIVWFGLVGLMALSVGACSISNADPSRQLNPDQLVRDIKVYESPT
jgi:hypothetical protein